MDRIELEQKIKESCDPSWLFNEFETISKRRLRSELSKIEYDELSELIMERLKKLDEIKRQLAS